MTCLTSGVSHTEPKREKMTSLWNGRGENLGNNKRHAWVIIHVTLVQRSLFILILPIQTMLVNRIAIFLMKRQKITNKFRNSSKNCSTANVANAYWMATIRTSAYIRSNWFRLKTGLCFVMCTERCWTRNFSYIFDWRFVIADANRSAWCRCNCYITIQVALIIRIVNHFWTLNFKEV